MTQWKLLQRKPRVKCSHLESCPCGHEHWCSGTLSTSLLLDPTVPVSAIRHLGFALSTCDRGCPCPGLRHKTPLVGAPPHTSHCLSMWGMAPVPCSSTGSTFPAYSSGFEFLHPQPGTTGTVVLGSWKRESQDLYPNRKQKQLRSGCLSDFQEPFSFLLGTQTAAPTCLTATFLPGPGHAGPHHGGH